MKKPPQPSQVETKTIAREPATLSRGMQARLLKLHQHFLAQRRDPSPNRRYSTAPELGKMVGWGDFAAKVRDLAGKNDLKTVVLVSRGLTASMIYELRDSGLDVRAYVENPNAPGDHFEMTRPWSPADRGPVLLVFADGGPVQAAVASRATLIEQFKTQIFITRGSGWTASAYRLN